MLMTHNFFSPFIPQTFRQAITHHQNALTQITSWMTSNLLSLNSSKNEFLLIGLKCQLSKIHNSSTSIDTTQSALNLGFIFDEHFSFSDQISALSKSCYHHVRALRCIRPYLDLHTAKTVATSIVHSKLDYCNSLYYGLRKFQMSVSNISRMLLLELLSRLQNSNTSLLFWNLFTGLKFLNELNIKSSLSLTKFSISLSLRIYMTLYLFSLLTVTTHALHLVTLIKP